MSVSLPDISTTVTFLSRQAAGNEYHRQIHDAFDKISRALRTVENALNSASTSPTVSSSSRLFTLVYDAALDGWPLAGVSPSAFIFRNGILQIKDTDYAINGTLVQFLLYPHAGNESVIAMAG